jgi:hypothetical protein
MFYMLADVHYLAAIREELLRPYHIHTGYRT